MTSDSKNERRKPRARVGSDTAMTWARSLRLSNPYANSILRAVALYMNEDGTAYPGITTIAADTCIAEETVSARLKWCEEIGAITLRKCWIDQHGRRIYEKPENHGRPTSSEIRFNFDADPEEIAANAVGATKPKMLRGAALVSHQAKASSPRPDGAQIPDPDPEISDRPGRVQNPVCTRLAPDQPPPRAARSLEVEKKDSVSDTRARENAVLAPPIAVALLKAKTLPHDALEGCGLPYQIEAWLNAGIDREFILATCHRVIATKPKFPHLNYLNATVRNAWNEHCAQPKTEMNREATSHRPASTGWQRSKDAFREARDKLSAAAKAGEPEADPGSRPPPEILPASRRG